MSTATQQAPEVLADPAQYRPGHTITQWTPEDPSFWPEGQGPEAQAAALKQSEMEAGAVTGFSSAIAAYGFFFIPAMFEATAVTNALWMFIGFYATCLAVCWWFYARKGAEAPS
ncbi:MULTISPECIES: hypothetical protein [Streptomyces]|uniref:hypothetical protein n=2 Tax=Streptomyces TaxID=1883 RepID=UPI001F371032|nr:MULTISPECIES: hypothetical protein [Streptomyces]